MLFVLFLTWQSKIRSHAVHNVLAYRINILLFALDIQKIKNKKCKKNSEQPCVGLCLIKKKK